MEEREWPDACSDGNLQRKWVGVKCVVKEGREVRLEERGGEEC